MTLFLTMLPFYLLGNVHCLGMCGPLVMMIGQHRFKYFYFLGRLLSFALAGMIAGEAGAILTLILQEYHISAAVSFLFGGVIIIIGIFTLFGWSYPGGKWVSQRMAQANRKLSILMLQDRAWPTFLFGFFTLALPCGQTVVVFSACALSGDMATGFANGLAFALLTTPSLFLAMRISETFKQIKSYYHWIMGICSIVIGVLALSRGFAEIGLIPHFIINPESSELYHIVLY